LAPFAWTKVILQKEGRHDRCGAHRSSALSTRARRPVGQRSVIGPSRIMAGPIGTCRSPRRDEHCSANSTMGWLRGRQAVRTVFAGHDPIY
jgi:hypothetical protein